jgi:hypothetical protein
MRPAAGVLMAAEADDRVMLKKRDWFYREINHSKHLNVVVASHVDNLRVRSETVGKMEVW